ncbi:MAG: hypothetical protein ACUVTY_07775 [Armatimonadota bacterium]
MRYEDKTQKADAKIVRVQTSSLTTRSARTVFQLAQQFVWQNPAPRTRGRKPRYPEALILTFALLTKHGHHSYRALRQLAQAEFPDTPLPALGTLCYRLAHISETRWRAFRAWLAEQGIALEEAI